MSLAKDDLGVLPAPILLRELDELVLDVDSPINISLKWGVVVWSRTMNR